MLFLFAVNAAVASEDVEIDWSRVKPISEYPEFWRGKATQAPTTRFPRGRQYHSINQEIANGNFTGRRRYQSINQQITNGNIAARYAFPFKAALISDMPYGPALCGASLLSRWAVLSSAHCIYGSTATTVILGANDISDPTEYRQARFKVQSSNYRIHPSFVEGVFRNDVAIVRFHYSIFTFTYAVNVINLPTGDELSELFEGEITQIMGFGRYSDASENYKYKLTHAYDLTIPSLLCRLMYFSIVDSSHVCTLGLLGNLCG